MSLQIGSRSFRSKAEVERHIRNMFWRYPAMGALAGEDLEFAMALIRMHPSRRQIIDVGIRSIHIQPVPFKEATQRRFLVKRTDESIRDFSWRNALSPKSMTRELAGVLRRAIRPQTREFFERNFKGICETCRQATDRFECEVDHASPSTFEQLMADWLKGWSMTAADITILRKAGYEQNSELEDKALHRSWVEYHRIHARLRCVCRRCNQSALRKIA